VEEGVVVHVQGGPGDLRAVGGNQDLLRSVAAYVANDDVFPSACLTAIAHVCGPIASPVANERHYGVDEAGPSDLTALSRRRHGVTFFVEKFEIAVGGPDMVIVRLLAPCGKYQFLRMAVAREEACCSRYTISDSAMMPRMLDGTEAPVRRMNRARAATVEG